MSEQPRNEKIPPVIVECLTETTVWFLAPPARSLIPEILFRLTANFLFPRTHVEGSAKHQFLQKAAGLHAALWRSVKFFAKACSLVLGTKKFENVKSTTMCSL